MLDVRRLSTKFKTSQGIVEAVSGVSFSVERGKTVGIVGESGSGKTVTCLSILGLNSASNTTVDGEVLFNGENLLAADAKRLRQIRGNDIAMIFQDPMTSLSPVHTIGAQLVEAILLHRDTSRAAARARSLDLLNAVGIPHAARRFHNHPHELSGGMCQRVMIAMALVNDPELLIADEPTTALDVTTQAQILDLMARLQKEIGTAIILITHDLGVIAEVADDVVVMYGGRVVEHAPVREIFRRPRHPYTWGLLGSLPRLNANTERLVQIPGSPPSLLNAPDGCPFHPRCRYAMEQCAIEMPQLQRFDKAGTHMEACHLDDATKHAEAERLIESMKAQVV